MKTLPAHVLEIALAVCVSALVFGIIYYQKQQNEGLETALAATVKTKELPDLLRQFGPWAKDKPVIEQRLEEIDRKIDHIMEKIDRE